MADFGKPLDVEALWLVRGRDFKHSFTNKDKAGNPVPWPAGDLFLELETGGEHNALHQVYITGATGGTYGLTLNGNPTPAIDYNDVSENPQGLAGDIQDAVDLAVGAGNALVHPVSLYPSWTLYFNLNSGKPLTEQLVNTINKAANDFFNTFDQLLGVDVQMTVTDALNFKLQVTSIRDFDEVGVVTFAVDVTATAVKNFFNGFAGLIGAVNTVSTDFYWNRTYNIEFTGSLALQPIPPTTANAAALTGASKSITTSVIDPGKKRLTKWPLTVSGADASIKVESEEADKIHNRCRWQLVHMPSGEAAGGDAKQLGFVYIQPR
ncbi:minor tail protein [Mycobacterium phage CRB1]|uniref:minor tail protein n=1 Tax=Mycobacterium phage CRB1 TaxID=1458841 RepID=UPI0003F1D8D2|nr:minor tail protein [Mycobacterium phage CRB1]AHJ86618.1 structural protein [Mycobacterium phage CRB1]